MDTTMNLEQALDFIDQNFSLESGTECNSKTSTIPHTLIIEEAESAEEGPPSADIYAKMYGTMTKRDFLSMILTEGVAIDRIVVRPRQQCCIVCEFPPDNISGTLQHFKNIYKHKGRPVSPQHQEALDKMGRSWLFGRPGSARQANPPPWVWDCLWAIHAEEDEDEDIRTVDDFVHAHTGYYDETEDGEREKAMDKYDRQMAGQDPDFNMEMDLMTYERYEMYL